MSPRKNKDSGIIFSDLSKDPMSNQSKPKSGPGRKKGEKPDQVIMFNRYNLMFYITIKGKNSKGEDVIIGRDYTPHKEHIAGLLKSYGRAIDTLTVKFLKAVKRCKYKEDILKHCPNLIVSELIDPDTYPIGTFFGEDVKSNVITNKDETLSNLDGLFVRTHQKLLDEGLNEIASGLSVKWGELKVCKNPPSKSKDPRQTELKQLKAFKW